MIARALVPSVTPPAKRVVAVVPEAIPVPIEPRAVRRAHRIGRARHDLEVAQKLMLLREAGSVPVAKDGTPWSVEQTDAEIERRLRAVREVIA